MAKSNSHGRGSAGSTRHFNTDEVKGTGGGGPSRDPQKGTYETARHQEIAALVSVTDKRQAEARTQEYLDELEFLAQTAGVEVKKRFVQRLDKPDVRTFVGEGKLAEIKAYVRHEGINLLIFDDDLSPSQLRNLEAELLIKIVDRSLLIIDIFAMRAKTATAQAQVELAQYQYLLPRLTGLWSHLDKQRGGGVSQRGPGETEIETDRRVVRDRIAFLKDKLKDLDKQSYTRRKSRDGVVRVALVGYTNVGKSTIMNLLSRSDVFAENKLFATVDSTVRKISFDNIPFLLSDTVGFIRKLPTRLNESFKSTLDEIREADLLVHVVDISHPTFEDQIEVVNATLKDIEAADKPMLLVFNKIDQYRHDAETERQAGFEGMNEDEDAPARPTLPQLQATYMANMHDPVIFISAQERENIDELRALLTRHVAKLHYQRYPNSLPPDNWGVENG
ncbi:MAG: GTPase HflX [Hymenobacter sp.]|nr:GTPase HflX [Hymenobacter sp.]